MKKFIKLIVFTLLIPFFLFSCNNKPDDRLLVYDHAVYQYNLPMSDFDVNRLEVSSSDPSLFTVSKLSNNEVMVNSNLNNKAGNGNINFTYDGQLVNYKVEVKIKHPTNETEAMNAFSLAAIKCNPDTPFSITFNFNNKLNEENFELSQEIYGRMAATNFISYSTGSNKTNHFQVNTGVSFAETPSGMKEGDDYYRYNPANINFLNHQPGSSHGLYIDSVKRTLDVDNSEELFWAVEHGYRPIISDSNTDLEDIYDAARYICSSTINPSWSNFEKFRALFEALERKTHYDYWVLDQEGYWFDYKAYFLEGVFLDEGKAVCDGFSKAYALLCGIEGLPCIRSYGFNNDSGHAWNYIQLDNNWYLTCPTWCKVGAEISDKHIVNLMNYDAFATTKNYFSDLGEPFSDLAFTTYNKSNRAYCSTSNLSLDKTPSGTSFFVRNDNDASKINEIVNNKICGDEAYVCIAFNKNTPDSSIERWAKIITNDVASKGYKSCTIFINNSKSYSSSWIYITKN